MDGEILTWLSDPLIISCLVSGFISIGILVYAYFYFKKPMAHILTRQGKILFQIGIKRINRTAEKFDFGDKTYIVDWNSTAWVDQKNRPHLLYLEGESRPLHLGNPEKLKISNTADKLNILAGKHTIMQLIRGSIATKFEGWLPVILSIVAGLGIGIIIGLFIYPHMFPIQQIQNATASTPAPALQPYPYG